LTLDWSYATVRWCLLLIAFCEVVHGALLEHGENRHHKAELGVAGTASNKRKRSLVSPEKYDMPVSADFGSNRITTDALSGYDSYRLNLFGEEAAEQDLAKITRKWHCHCL
jgi:hypothetical protein